MAAQGMREWELGERESGSMRTERVGAQGYKRVAAWGMGEWVIGIMVDWGASHDSLGINRMGDRRATVSPQGERMAFCGVTVTEWMFGE